MITAALGATPSETPGLAGESSADPIDMSPGRPLPASENIKTRFQRQRRRDTKPELALRRLLHRRGHRYFVDRPPLAGMRRRADIVFPRRRVAVFIDGCFWHRCPQHGTTPANNKDWWIAKLDRNVERDRDTDDQLREAGWTVLRFWEHEDPEDAAATIEMVLHLRPGASKARIESQPCNLPSGGKVDD